MPVATWNLPGPRHVPRAEVEIMPDLLTYVLMLIPLAIAGGLIFLYLRTLEAMKAETKIPHGMIKKDWVATGRIDFASEDAADTGDADRPAEFKLLVEQRRIVESITGNESFEIQWRLASLREAKVVITQYHKFLADHAVVESVSDEPPAPATTAAPVNSSEPTSKPHSESVVRMVASSNS
jgi:hypothetical protein